MAISNSLAQLTQNQSKVTISNLRFKLKRKIYFEGNLNTNVTALTLAMISISNQLLILTIDIDKMHLPLVLEVLEVLRVQLVPCLPEKQV